MIKNLFQTVVLIALFGTLSFNLNAFVPPSNNHTIGVSKPKNQGFGMPYSHSFMFGRTDTTSPEGKAVIAPNASSLSSPQRILEH